MKLPAVEARVGGEVLGLVSANGLEVSATGYCLDQSPVKATLGQGIEGVIIRKALTVNHLPPPPYRFDSDSEVATKFLVGHR